MLDGAFPLNREFYAIVRNADLPSPECWLEVLSKFGLSVSWRYYGGSAVDPLRVPREYEGWFLQETDRVESTTGGVFFFVAKSENDDFRISLQRHTEEDAPLWSACAQFLGSFPSVEVRCGNAILSGPDWLAHVANRRS